MTILETMPKETKFPHKGKLVDAVELEFKYSEESTGTLQLEDGSVLHVKVVPQKVLRLVSEYNDSGEPIYVMQAASLVTASVSADLIKAVGAGDEKA